MFFHYIYTLYIYIQNIHIYGDYSECLICAREGQLHFVACMHTLVLMNPKP